MACPPYVGHRGARRRLTHVCVFAVCVVSYSQHQEGQHVVMYEENGGRQWEGWDLPDPELCFLKRSPQCQIVVTDDMLSTAQ